MIDKRVVLILFFLAAKSIAQNIQLEITSDKFLFIKRTLFTPTKSFSRNSGSQMNVVTKWALFKSHFNDFCDDDYSVEFHTSVNGQRILNSGVSVKSSDINSYVLKQDLESNCENDESFDATFKGVEIEGNTHNLTLFFDINCTQKSPKNDEPINQNSKFEKVHLQIKKINPFEPNLSAPSPLKKPDSPHNSIARDFDLSLDNNPFSIL